MSICLNYHAVGMFTSRQLPKAFSTVHWCANLPIWALPISRSNFLPHCPTISYKNYSVISLGLSLLLAFYQHYCVLQSPHRETLLCSYYYSRIINVFGPRQSGFFMAHTHYERTWQNGVEDQSKGPQMWTLFARHRPEKERKDNRKSVRDCTATYRAMDCKPLIWSRCVGIDATCELCEEEGIAEHPIHVWAACKEATRPSQKPDHFVSTSYMLPCDLGHHVHGGPDVRHETNRLQGPTRMQRGRWLRGQLLQATAAHEVSHDLVTGSTAWLVFWGLNSSLRWRHRNSVQNARTWSPVISTIGLPSFLYA